MERKYVNTERELEKHVKKYDKKRMLIMYGVGSECKIEEVYKIFESFEFHKQRNINFVKIYSVNRPMVVVCLEKSVDMKKYIDAINAEEYTGIRGEKFFDKVLKNSEFKKNSRIVVRNFLFENLKEDFIFKTFKVCGPILSISINKKIGLNNKLVNTGCFFVQFYHTNDAKRAVALFNEKVINRRTIVVDLAVLKKDYERNDKKTETQSESENENETESENQNERSEGEYVKKVKENAKLDKQLNDVSQQKTVFLKNVNWLSTEEKLQEVMEKFGPVYYVKFNKNQLNNQFKGTAFCKFKKRESAEKCVNTEVTLDNNIIQILPAITRDEVSKLYEEKNKKVDKRNLYLLKEGLAENDELIEQKEKKLKDTNFFISDKRLCIRNLPFTVTAGELSRKFQKLGGKGTILKQVVIKKSEKQTNRSFGYGFVTFAKHENALLALKNSANKKANEIFPNTTFNGTLIVDFSVENAQALNKQKMRKLAFQKNIIQTAHKKPQKNQVN